MKRRISLSSLLCSEAKLMIGAAVSGDLDQLSTMKSTFPTDEGMLFNSPSYKYKIEDYLHAHLRLDW